MNLGPSSVETWGSGLGFVACSRCTCADNLAFDGDLTGSRVECIAKGKSVDKVRCVYTLHTNIQVFKYTHSVVWSDEVLKFLHVFCLGNVQVRIEDRRLMGLHDSTVHQFQDDDFETLVDWALSYIQNLEHGSVPSSDIETDS